MGMEISKEGNVSSIDDGKETQHSAQERQSLQMLLSSLQKSGSGMSESLTPVFWMFWAGFDFAVLCLIGERW